jgi:uncharacterized protein YggE
VRTTIVIIMLLVAAAAGCTGAAVSGDQTAPSEGDAAAEPAVAVPPDQLADAGAEVAAGDVAVGGATAAISAETGGVAPGITVSGSGQATGTPDVVRVTVGVRVVRETVDEALDAANAAAERVITALDGAGVAAEDRQTRDFSISPEYGDRGDGGSAITGYAVSNLIEAKIRDVGGAGAVLTAVADAGGDDTQIQGVSFALEDDGEQIAAAREAAFADALVRAEQYAQIVGVTLGDLIGITDVTVSSPRSADVFADATAEGAAVPIEPGTQQVTVSVTVRWALQS